MSSLKSPMQLLRTGECKTCRQEVMLVADPDNRTSVFHKVPLCESFPESPDPRPWETSEAEREYQANGVTWREAPDSN